MKFLLMITSLLFLASCDGYKDDPKSSEKLYRTFSNQWFNDIVENVKIDVHSLKVIKTMSNDNNPMIDKATFESLSKEMNTSGSVDIKRTEPPQKIKEHSSIIGNNTDNNYYRINSSEADITTVINFEKITVIMLSNFVCYQFRVSNDCAIIKTKNYSFLIDRQDYETCHRKVVYKNMEGQPVRNESYKCEDYNDKLYSLIYRKMSEFKEKSSYANLNLLKKDLAVK